MRDEQHCMYTPLLLSFSSCRYLLACCHACSCWRETRGPSAATASWTCCSGVVGHLAIQTLRRNQREKNTEGRGWKRGSCLCRKRPPIGVRRSGGGFAA